MSDHETPNEPGFSPVRSERVFPNGAQVHVSRHESTSWSGCPAVGWPPTTHAAEAAAARGDQPSSDLASSPPWPADLVLSEPADLVLSEFDLITTRTDEEIVVRLIGELDLATAPRLDEELAGLAVGGAPHVTLDLAELVFIDSTGLSALVSGLERLRDMGGSLVLRSPNASTMKVLEITGLTGVFDITKARLAREQAGRATGLSTESRSRL